MGSPKFSHHPQVLNLTAEVPHHEARMAPAGLRAVWGQVTMMVLSLPSLEFVGPGTKRRRWFPFCPCNGFISVPLSYGIYIGCGYVSHLVRGLQNGEGSLEGIST